MSNELIYESPTEKTSAEVLEILSRPDTTPSQRKRALLSAIFHSEEVAFAGDLLLKEFATANYGKDHSLLGLFETFYHSRGTTYRIDESIGMMETYKKRFPDDVENTQQTVEALLEFKIMFAGR